MDYDAFALNLRMLKRHVTGLIHADSLLQPAPRGNCLNWVLGYIAVHRDDILMNLGEERVFGEERSVRYDAGSDPIVGEDPGVVPLQTLLDSIDLAQERIAENLARISEAAIKTTAIKFGLKTVAAAVVFLHWHETYHVGQTEFLGQLSETDDKVIQRPFINMKRVPMTPASHDFRVD